MSTVLYTVLDGEVIAEDRNGVRKEYLPDPLGSTVALLDSNQNQTDTFSYWPYGEVNVRTGSTPTPFQFVGTQGYYQDSSSKTYVRARHLDTQKGRWLTPDPIWFKGGDFNLYRYVTNQPVSSLDPSGLQCQGPPCSFGKFSKQTQQCANQCLAQDGGWQDIVNCMNKCLKKNGSDWIKKLACYILACVQYGGQDPCKNPDATKFDVDCMCCASFQLTECICNDRTLKLGIKCYPPYEKQHRKCECLPSV